MDIKTLVDLVGWFGAAALLTAYALVSLKRMAGDSFGYQMLNLVGGACLIVNTFFYGAFPSSVVNLVWIGIAVYTLLGARPRA